MCTEWASFSDAEIHPLLTIFFIFGSRDRIHETGISFRPRPPSGCEGSGAKRVQRTNPSVVQSPEATPNEKGDPLKLRFSLPADLIDRPAAMRDESMKFLRFIRACEISPEDRI